MAMFDDPKKELQLLQEQLLQDEEWFARELDSAKRMIGDVPTKKAPSRGAAGGSAPKTASAPRRPQPAPVPVKKKKGIGGLVVLALLETCGIVGIAAYWLLVLLK